MQHRGAIHAIPTTVHGLLSLMRPPNAFISFLAILSTGVMAAGSITTSAAVVQAAFAGMLIGSAGNIINDVYDMHIDRINKPGRAIAAGIVSRTAATIWALTCAAGGIALSITLGVEALTIAAASVLLLFVYSAWLKRLPLLGNLLVGLVTGAAFLYGGYAAGTPEVGVIPAVFACVMNVGREILKDIEDLRGDLAAGLRTFPIVAGVVQALRLTGILLLAVASLSVLPLLLGEYSIWYLPFVILVIAAILVSLSHARRGEHARASAALKWGMLAGILAFTVGSIQ
jgi:geranylgeranylglycerol-phosphate geranylgeranyltransferase